jgi:hypothetical protein
MSSQDLVTRIISGEADDNLDSIYQAYRERSRIVRATKAAINRATITPGTRVRLVNINPKYLRGRQGVVVAGGRGQRIAVELDVPEPRFGNPLNVPPTALEPVE